MNTAANSVAVPGMPGVPSAAEPGEAIMPATQAATQDDGNANGISPAAAMRLPVDARGVSLGILSTVAVVFALNWAQGFVISLLLGILFAYTLNPLVVWLERVRIPRVLSASIVMIGVISTLLLGSYALQKQVQRHNRGPHECFVGTPADRRRTLFSLSFSYRSQFTGSMQIGEVRWLKTAVVLP